MDELTKVQIELAECKVQVGAVERYIEEDKEVKNQMIELMLTVKGLTLTIQNMVKAQQAIEDKLNKMQSEPAEMMQAGKRAVITTVLSVISSSLVTFIAMSILGK